MKELFQALSENLSFVLVCVGIFAALVLLAALAERALRLKVHRPGKSRYIAFVGMSAAVAGVLMLMEIPIPFLAPSFYQMDFSEIPVLICSFYLGPVAGVATEFLKVVIKLLLKGTTSAFVGDFANFARLRLCDSGVFAVSLPQNKKMAAASLAAGTISLTVFGSIFNALYLLPTFSIIYGMPLDAIVGAAQAINPAITDITQMVLFAVMPFNLVKGLLVSVITFLLYKRVERALGRLFSKQ